MSDIYQPQSIGGYLDIMLRSVKANRPTVRTQPGSVLRLDYQAFAQALADNSHHSDAIARNTTPLFADEIGLAKWGIVTGVPRKAGEPARKAQAGRARGVAATLIPQGSVLNHTGGLQYETTADATVGSGGDVLLDLQALESGTITRLDAGEELTFDVTIPNVEPSVTLERALDEGGTDEQSIGAWRRDILLVWQQGRQGGSRSDYEVWSTSVAWVSRAFVYPNKPSIASVGIVGLKSGTGAAQLPTPTEEQELLDALNVRPVTDTVGILTVILTLLDVEVEVELAPGVEPSWSRPGTPGITVASWNPAAQEITINESLPGDFNAGSLFTMVSPGPAAGADGRVTRVSAVTGAQTFVVAPYTGEPDAFNYVPVAGDAIWPSSEVMASMRAAVLNGYEICVVEDGVEIRIAVPGLYDLGPANPGHKHGSWEADARESAIEMARTTAPTKIVSATATIAGAVDGVRESIEFEYPLHRVVELLIPGQVWVHA